MIWISVHGTLHLCLLSPKGDAIVSTDQVCPGLWHVSHLGVMAGVGIWDRCLRFNGAVGQLGHPDHIPDYAIKGKGQ